MPWNKPYAPVSNQRLDPELYQLTGYITFIKISAYNDLRPFTNLSLNQQIIEILQTEEDRHLCAVYTYCLMPDHLHYLISPSQDRASVVTFTNSSKASRPIFPGNLGGMVNSGSLDFMITLFERMRTCVQ